MSQSQGSSPLLSPMDYSVGLLAPADFADLNAGAGPSTEIARLGNTLAGTHILQQRVMSEIHGATVDERDWIRTWRKKIKDTVSRFSENFHDFLIRKETTDPEVISKAKLLINRIYSNIPSNNKNYFSELGWDISMNQIQLDLETDLNLNFNDVKESQKKIIRVYSDTLRELFLIDARLHEKLVKLQVITEKIQAVMHIENNAELGPMADATANYLTAVMKNNDINSDFIMFMITYKRWLLLNDIIQLQRVITIGGVPICNICATAEVTHAMIPCGHTFCSGCITKQMSHCYMCRTGIRDRLRLHFP